MLPCSFGARSLVLRATRRIFRRLGVAVPLINPVPNPVTLHMRLGHPGLQVGLRGSGAARWRCCRWNAQRSCKAKRCSAGRMPWCTRSSHGRGKPGREWVGRYLLKLAELFEEHAATCLPQEVAAQGAPSLFEPQVAWRSFVQVFTWCGAATARKSWTSFYVQRLGGSLSGCLQM